MSDPTPLIQVNSTIGNFRPCDYGLNRLADKIQLAEGDSNRRARAINFAQHAIQCFSYITHPVDLGIQGISYPILLGLNPFITIGINIGNRTWKKALGGIPLLPVKLAMAVPKVIAYEGVKIVELAWSIFGFNALVNTIKGKKQTEIFFLKRIYEKNYVKGLNEYREKALLTPKKVITIPDLYKPKIFQNKDLTLNALDAHFEGNNRSRVWLVSNAVRANASVIFYNFYYDLVVKRFKKMTPAE